MSEMCFFRNKFNRHAFSNMNTLMTRTTTAGLHSKWTNLTSFSDTKCGNRKIQN